jgi:prepilin-type processing-associated H-X9-DG protein
MLELLLTVAIIALLVGLLFPVLHKVKRSGDMTRELAAARQLLVAYNAYAYDHRGVLMPGYYSLNGEMLPARDEAGNELSGPGPLAARYPWRLAPYLDFNLRGIYLDVRLLEGFANEELYHYYVSLYPALGINSVFVGGDTDSGLGNPQMEALFGKFYLTRLSQARRPVELIVFASARINGELAEGPFGSAAVVEGFHRISPPYFTQRDWADRYDPACPSPDCQTTDFGNVSLRHGFREAAVGFLDGHTGPLNEGQILDMRHWADGATKPDWVLEPQ